MRILMALGAFCFTSFALAQGIPGAGQVGIPVLGAVSPSGSLTTTPATIFNLDKDYAAVGDFNQGRGASITAGANVLSGGSTSCSASADTGKTILIPGAGTGGAAINTAILGCSGSSYVLAANAAYSANASSYWVGYSGVQVYSDGTGCAPGDVLTLTGGTAALQGSLTVNTCQVHSAAFNSGTNTAGTGGTTNGATYCVLQDAGTFTGEPFRIYATISGGGISGLGPFIHKGDYTANPTSLSNEKVSGCGLSGSPTITITMGVSQQVDPGSGVTVTSPGNYSATPTSEPIFVGSTTGAEGSEAFNVYFVYGGIYSFGTNNYAAFNNALTAAGNAGGGIVQMGCSGKYLVSGGNLTFTNVGSYFTDGANIRLAGCYNLGKGGVWASVSGPAGAGVYFDPTGGYTITVRANASLEHVQIYNPLMSYGYNGELYRPTANRNASHSGTSAAVTLSYSGSLSNVMIVGYYLGLSEINGGPFIIDKLYLDDRNGIELNNVYNYSMLRASYCDQNVTISTGYGPNVSANISAISNYGGQIQITLAAAPMQNSNPVLFQPGDTVYVSGAGSLPNAPVTGYPAADGTWTIGQAIDATHYVLANSTYNAGQTYVSGGVMGWYPVHQGDCLYYNGIGGGNDGLWVDNLMMGGWLVGIHSFGVQGIHFDGDADNGFSPDPNQIGLWLDGATKSSEIIGGEFQQEAMPLLNTTYGATTQGNRVVAGQFLSNGNGPAINQEGTVPLSVAGWQTANGLSGWINIGDGAGQIIFGGASSLTNLSFTTQSYQDWASVVISPDAAVGGSQSLTGGFVLPPAPMNAMGALTNGLNNPLGACDVGQAPAICLGLRRELSTYTGPLVNVTRASDSKTLALYADVFGNLNQAMCAAFAAGTTLTVNEVYDQSGNGNNAVQATAANQPGFLCASPTNGRPVIVNTNGVAQEMVISGSSSWQGWASGSNPGSVLMTLQPTANAVNADRIFLDNGGGGTNSVGVYFPSGGSTIQINAGYTTTSGSWITSGGLSQSAVSILDITYQWTSTTNIPAIDFNGVSQSFGTSTTPVGTAGVDTGVSILLFGNGNTSTTPNAYYTTLVMWKGGPSASLLEQARKAEGAYYGATVN